MLHPLEHVRDHQNPLADTPALASCQAPQLGRPRFAAKKSIPAYSSPINPSSPASESVSYLGVSLSTGHGSRETESAEGRRLFLVTYRPSIRSSRAAGAKAVNGIAGSGENCVARLFGQ